MTNIVLYKKYPNDELNFQVTTKFYTGYNVNFTAISAILFIHVSNCHFDFRNLSNTDK
jgi:hypothetical protein